MLEKGWVKAALIGLGIDLLLGVLGMIPCVNCLICPINLVAWLVIPIGVGVMTAVWDGLNKNDLGAAAAVLVKSALLYAGLGMVIYIILAIAQAALSSIFDLGTTTFFSQYNDTNNELASEALSGPFKFFASTIGAVVCGGIGFILDLLLVMVGGIVAAAVREE